MLWRRQKQLIVPPKTPTGVWRTHCQLPTLLPLSGSRWRLYFSGRDEHNRSHGLFAELDLSHGVEVTDIQTSPVLSPGVPGAFDAEGAMPSSFLWRGKELWLYYCGISVRRDVPWQVAIGLAVSRDGGLSFQRATPGPVLGQGPMEPFSCFSPLVLDEGDELLMYYPSMTAWRSWNGQMEPLYALKLARSSDGVGWTGNPDLLVDFSDDQEGGITRPSILSRGGRAHMLFSHRGWKDYRTSTATAYHFGYAVSDGGERWTRRDDDVGFVNPPDPDDWDGMMQAYPAMIQVGDEVLCFYCGNGFGQAGIGYATLEGGVASLDPA